MPDFTPRPRQQEILDYTHGKMSIAALSGGIWG
jgi:hypothetical protein